MKSFTLSTAALVASAFLQTVAAEPLIQVLARENRTLSTFNSLLNNQRELVNTLTSRRNITILAPSNDAFADLLQDQNMAGRVNSDPSFVKNLLSYHVINGTYRSTDFSDEPFFPKTLLTDRSVANVTGGQVVDLKTQNNNATIGSAYDAIAQVTRADIGFDGGIIHIIDSVLEIPASLPDTAAAANLTSIAEALTKANLVNTLASASDITVFAPNNAAFQAIASTAQNLSTEELQSVLKYHVIQGVAYSSSLQNGTVKSLEGSNLNITVQDDGKVFVNAVRVVTPDVLISNGVLHVVDTVLMQDGNDDSSSPSATATSSGGATGTTGTSGTSSPTGSHTSASTKSSAYMALTIAIGAAAMFINGL
ncbi:hypothetical protein HIM_00946 [Hirsutella minnesotensis 3608]|nr:hypothetical protein HIM_00946 [Hirsutella minnesotensis 3608]